MGKKNRQKENKNQRYTGARVLLLGFCVMACLVLFMAYRFMSSIPDTVGRELTAAERQEIIGRNSSMIDYIWLTANADFPRGEKIQKITIHHMAGNFTLEQVGKDFSTSDRKASSNYAIDSTGRVALYVEESNRPWSSSSKENDDMAITIEVANDKIGGDWHVSDAAYEKLIELCADICRRNGIEKLIFTGDATGNLTLHKMFSKKTECPGAYLESKMVDISDAVNQKLSTSDSK